MRVGIIRCMQTEDHCPGTADFKAVRDRKGAFGEVPEGESIEIVGFCNHCPECGAEMEPWMRSRVFLEGRKYRGEYTKLNDFLRKNRNKNMLFLEIGVGRMTPMFIQEPFWNMTYALPQAFYITVNPKDAYLPKELENKGLAIREDIAEVLIDTKKLAENGK